MPKLWAETIETHRREVLDAIIEGAGDLVHRRGLLGVSMSAVADSAGIGRATLYKYFPDVEAVLTAWHRRHVEGHLSQLEELRNEADGPSGALRAVLAAYARICLRRHEHGNNDPGPVLHRDEQIAALRVRLHDLVTDAIVVAASAGAVRADVPADELADFCLHALGSAATLSSEDQVDRLVGVVWAALAYLPAGPVCGRVEG